MPRMAWAVEGGDGAWAAVGYVVGAMAPAGFGANIIFLMFWNGDSKRSVSIAAVSTIKKYSWTFSCEHRTVSFRIKCAQTNEKSLYLRQVPKSINIKLIM